MQLDLSYRCLDCGQHNRILTEEDLADILQEIKEYTMGVTDETPDRFTLTVEVKEVRSGHAELGIPTVPNDVNGKRAPPRRRPQR